MSENDAIKRALQRERIARKAAERILEDKSRELFESNEKLRRLNASLEIQVAERTKEINTYARQQEALFEKNPLPVMVCAMTSFTFLHVNQTAVEKYGYSREEFLTMCLSDLSPERDMRRLKEELDSNASGQEWKHHSASGLLMDVEITWTAIEFNGQPARMILINDVTTQKEAVRALIKNETKYRELIESASDIIYRCDVEGNFTYANPMAEHVSGYGHDELMTMSFSQLVRPDYKNKVEEFYNKQISDEVKASYMEFPIIEKAGKEIWLGQTVDWSYDEEGEVEFRALCKNVSEKVQARLALQRSEEKYRSIIENLELGILEVDQKGEIITAYPKFCALVGYKQEELVGQNPLNLLVPEEFHAHLKSEFSHRPQGQSSVYETQLRHKNGHRIWVMISGAPFFNERGEVAGSIGIHLDISDQKKIEQELLIAKDEAESSVRSKEVFMANMSHEIRTPMNAIIGMSEILSNSSLNDKQSEYLNAIRTSADNMLIIINDILDFSKIEAGKLDISLIPVDMPKLLSDSLKTLELKAEQKGIILELSRDQKIGSYQADPTRLGQVLINLLSNAVKFTESGKVTLACRCMKSEKGVDELLFSVTDTGIGVESSKLEKIFESFMQAEESTARTYGGTGLGLPISRALVQMMGGDLLIESQVGIGTTFSFQIALTTAPSDHQVGRTHAEDITIPAGCSVLLVEDNDINRFMAQTILENWSCQISHASDGQEAVDLVARHQYDIVLMDMSMPVMNGLDATRLIRQSLKSNVPIIGLTANALKGDREKCIAAGMNDYVSKPFSQTELKRKIAALLDAEVLKPIKKTINTGSSPTDMVDLSALKRSTDGDQDFMAKMIQLFIDDAGSKASELDLAVSTKDVAEIRKIAHSMKPSIDHLANAEMQALVRIIEGKELSESDHIEQTNQFSALLLQLKHALKSHI